VLFAIRGKLGDSLVLAMAVRRYVETHSRDEVVLAIRKDYARLLEGEPRLRMVAFDSRLEMAAKLLWLRWSAPRFDVLAVLWGFGPPIRMLGRMVRARRKILFQDRHRDVFPESAGPLPDHDLITPALAVIERFAPGMRAPTRLELPALAALRTRTTRSAIGVVPIADELRKNWDKAALEAMLRRLVERHPGRPIRVFVNPANVGADAILAIEFLPPVELRPFSRLAEVVAEYAQLEAWYGVDTGLYHLAVAMGIPATVFFGPTQPWKIVMPGQPQTTWVRLGVLGKEHCEEKTCARPLCLTQAAASFCGAPPAGSLGDTPVACPLRAHAPEALAAIQVHESTDRQARQAG
jgi:hypothetical protein